jgi:hypothetical protein
LTLLTACHFGGPRDRAHAAAAASRDREKRDGYDYSDSKVFWEWMPWFRMYGQMMENAVGFSLFFPFFPSFLPPQRKRMRDKRGGRRTN